MIFWNLVCISLKSSLSWQYSLSVYQFIIEALISIVRVYFHQHQCFVSLQHEIEIFSNIIIWSVIYSSSLLGLSIQESNHYLVKTDLFYEWLLFWYNFRVFFFFFLFWCCGNMLLHVTIISLSRFSTFVLHCIIFHLNFSHV